MCELAIELHHASRLISFKSIMSRLLIHGNNQAFHGNIKNFVNEKNANTETAPTAGCPAGTTTASGLMCVQL